MTDNELGTIFIKRQGLDVRLPVSYNYTHLLEKLGCIQIDPVSVVTPNLNLVALNRLTTFNERDYINSLSTQDSFEYFAHAMCNIHNNYVDSIGLILYKNIKQLTERRAFYHTECNNILVKIAHKPLRSVELDGEIKVNNPWTGLKSRSLASTLLEMMVDTGEITVVDRIGGQKVYDIRQPFILDKKTDYYRALFNLYLQSRTLIPANSKIAWLKGHKSDFLDLKTKLLSDKTIIEVNISGKTFLLKSLEDEIEARSTDYLRLLSPLDNFLWDRKLISHLFQYNYKWEIYTPQDKRKHGPYSMPILFNNQIIGELSLSKINSVLSISNGVMNTELYRSDLVSQLLNDELSRLAQFLSLDPDFDYWSNIKKI